MNKWYIYIYSLRGVFGCKCSFWTLNSSPLWCFSWLLSVVTITLRHCNLNWPLAQMVSNYLSLFTTWLWMLKEKTNHKFELNFTWNHFEQNHRYWNVLCSLLVINKQLSCFKSDCFTCSYLHSGIFFSGLSNCKIIVGYIFINWILSRRKLYSFTSFTSVTFQ